MTGLTIIRDDQSYYQWVAVTDDNFATWVNRFHTRAEAEAFVKQYVPAAPKPEEAPVAE